MVIGRERYLDDSSRFLVTLNLSTKTGDMHSLVSGLPQEVHVQIAEALVDALDRIGQILKPHLPGSDRQSADHFGCGT